MQKATTKDNTSLFYKLVACALSIMLVISYTSIAYALDDEASTTASTATEEESSDVATEESVSEEATDTEEAGDTTASEAEETSDSDAEQQDSSDATNDEADLDTALSPSVLSETSLLDALEEEEESPITYLDKDGKEQTIAASEVTVIDSDCEEEVTWTAGWYVVQGEVSYSSRITISGNVHLILADESKLTASYSITVNDSDGALTDGTLTIYAQSTDEATMGVLVAGGGRQGDAAIGGLYGYSNGAITINGGNITAGSPGYGAAIGGGVNASGHDITINGGIVTATGNDSAAAIGGGNGGAGYDITITGGSVTATGGIYAAAIGGGDRGAGYNIYVNGGTVTASGGQGGAAIGGGTAAGYNIYINGGTVIATGGSNAAGIGGGEYNSAVSGSGQGYNIYISGGTVIATGSGNGAGIGGGYGGAGYDIKITGGTVEATGGSWAAGIGGGYAGSGYRITIENSTVTATSDGRGAGIGGGGEWCAGYDITITNSTVIAISDYAAADSDGFTGAGIGGGRRGYGYNITITNSTVMAIGGQYATQGGAGIGGGGYNGSGYNITITDSDVTATGGSYSAGIGGGHNGTGYDITISGGTVTATGGVNAAGIGGGYNGSGYSIEITGGTVTATGGENAAGIGGGYLGYGKGITISGGTVTATAVAGGGAGIGSGANGSTAENIVISNGSVKALSEEGSAISVTPTDKDGNSVYLLEIPDMSGTDEITIDEQVDEKTYTRSGDHPDNDTTFYVYVTGENHELVVNEAPYRAVWQEDTETFALKQYIDASFFVFSAPSNLVYDGADKIATVEANAGITGMGEITVYYSSDDGVTWTTAVPTDVGTYQVAIQVAEGDSYIGTEGKYLTAEEWTFAVYQTANSWITELSIDGWTYGEDANEPVAEAAYGEVVFTYSTSVNGEYTSEVPTEVGTYYVKATVEGTSNYAGLEATKEFTIAEALSETDDGWTTIVDLLPKTGDNIGALLPIIAAVALGACAVVACAAFALRRRRIH